jgi:hypothetical protein
MLYLQKTNYSAHLNVNSRNGIVSTSYKLSTSIDLGEKAKYIVGIRVPTAAIEVTAQLYKSSPFIEFL